MTIRWKAVEQYFDYYSVVIFQFSKFGNFGLGIVQGCLWCYSGLISEYVFILMSNAIKLNLILLSDQISNSAGVQRDVYKMDLTICFLVLFDCIVVYTVNVSCSSNE